MKAYLKSLRPLFTYENQYDRVLIAFVILINFIVLINAIIHHPKMGYDAIEHKNIIEIYPQRFPTPEDSYEYFSPPLPYILPSIVNDICVETLKQMDNSISCSLVHGKFAQFTNLGFSIGITILLLNIMHILTPKSRSAKLFALSILGVSTVYYKLFAFVRGEPFVAFFFLWAIYEIIKLIMNLDQIHWKQGIKPGIILGFMMLSRQWGIFIFPVLVLIVAFALILYRKEAVGFSTAISVAGIIAFAISSWFYFHLYFSYGSFTSYVIDTPGFAISNQPNSFYRNTGLNNGLLFKEPTRTTFGNSFIPIYYSETWGDYWGYFVFVRDKSYAGLNGFANQQQITPYLGRVNLVSLVPSAIMGWGLLYGTREMLRVFRAHDHKEKSKFLIITLLFLTIVLSFVGNLWFLIAYPVELGRSIKSGYMLQMFMLLPVLSALALETAQKKIPCLTPVILSLLSLVFLHNLPAMISRYWWWLQG